MVSKLIQGPSQLIQFSYWVQQSYMNRKFHLLDLFPQYLYHAEKTVLFTIILLIASLYSLDLPE